MDSLYCMDHQLHIKMLRIGDWIGDVLDLDGSVEDVSVDVMFPRHMLRRVDEFRSPSAQDRKLDDFGGDGWSEWYGFVVQKLDYGRKLVYNISVSSWDIRRRRTQIHTVVYHHSTPYMPRLFHETYPSH